MATVGIRTLKDQLSSYIQRASAGEEIVVLRSGKPVAALVPLSAVVPATEEGRLAALAEAGLLRLPRSAPPSRGDRLPVRGVPPSTLVVEDRR